MSKLEEEYIYHHNNVYHDSTVTFEVKQAILFILDRLEMLEPKDGGQPEQSQSEGE